MSKREQWIAYKKFSSEQYVVLDEYDEKVMIRQISNDMTYFDLFAKLYKPFLMSLLIPISIAVLEYQLDFFLFIC